MSLNRVVLIGRLTKDPDLKYTPAGVPIANFFLAVNRHQAPDANGERGCDFIPCVAFRQSAEFAANYLGKGRLAAVEGRLQVRKWETRDGQARWSTEVIVDRIQGLERRHNGGDAPDTPASASASGPADDWGDVPDPFAE